MKNRALPRSCVMLFLPLKQYLCIIYAHAYVKELRLDIARIKSTHGQVKHVALWLLGPGGPISAISHSSHHVPARQLYTQKE